jgi:hypothetical protein
MCSISIQLRNDYLHGSYIELTESATQLQVSYGKISDRYLYRGVVHRALVLQIAMVWYMTAQRPPHFSAAQEMAGNASSLAAADGVILR